MNNRKKRYKRGRKEMKKKRQKRSVLEKPKKRMREKNMKQRASLKSHHK